MLIWRHTRSIVWALTLVIAFAGLAAAAETALERAKAQGKLIACADPYNLPFSSPDLNTPGFDVEIANEIAKGIGLSIGYHWEDTGTRGGLGRALRLSIGDGKCDFFMGLPTDEDMAEEFAEKRLALTKPYFGSGYVIVRKQGGPEARKLEDLKDTKIAVIMFTVVDRVLSYDGYKQSVYRRSEEALEALQQGEIEVGLILAAKAGWWIQQHPDSGVQIVEGYVPEPNMRTNVAIGVRQKDKDLKEAINQQIEQLIQNGRIKEIMAKYGVPFYPPFE